MLQQYNAMLQIVPNSKEIFSTVYQLTKKSEYFFSTLVMKDCQAYDDLFLPCDGLQVSQEGDYLVFVEKLGLLTTQNGTQQVGQAISMFILLQPTGVRGKYLNFNSD